MISCICEIENKKQKKKEKNKQKNKLIDMDNRTMFTREAGGGWVEDDVSEEGQVYVMTDGN